MTRTLALNKQIPSAVIKPLPREFFLFRKISRLKRQGSFAAFFVRPLKHYVNKRKREQFVAALARHH